MKKGEESLVCHFNSLGGLWHCLKQNPLKEEDVHFAQTIWSLEENKINVGKETNR